MYLSRLYLNRRSRVVLKDLADCHNLHRTLMSAFPEVQDNSARAQIGLLYRLDESVNGPCLLVQSEIEPDWSGLDPARLLLPPVCKSVAEAYGSLTAGRILRFCLRANPTRKIMTKSGADGRRNNGKRVELRTEQEWIAWLERKASQHGFRLESVRAAAETPNVRTVKLGKFTGNRNGRPLTLFAIQFEGRLIIENSDFFEAA